MPLDESKHSTGKTQRRKCESGLRNEGSSPSLRSGDLASGRAFYNRQLSPLHTARSWNNADLVNRAIDRVLEFFTHLETSFFASSPAPLAFIQSARNAITPTLKNVNTLARQEMDFPP